MKPLNRSKQRQQRVLFLLCALSVLLLSFGCTVTPKRAVAQSISFDGTNQNSGFIGWDQDGYGMITRHARDRYVSLVLLYGDRFAPPLLGQPGVSPYHFDPPEGYWRITPEALVNFQIMNAWRKQDAGKP